MQRCGSTAELVGSYGEPAHKVAEPGMQIWHYPLGIAKGTLYSVHVAVTGESAPMAYMHMEPSGLPDTASGRPWWKFW